MSVQRRTEKVKLSSDDFKTWAKRNNVVITGTSGQVGSGKGIVLELNGITAAGKLLNAEVDLAGNKGKIAQRDARLILDAVAYAAKANKDIAKAHKVNPAKITTPTTNSLAGPHASDHIALKPDQKPITETGRHGWFYASNFRLGKNTLTRGGNTYIDYTKPFDLKDSITRRLINTFKLDKDDVKIQGRLGHWTYSSKGNPSVVSIFDNDGNVVVTSSVPQRKLKANSIYVHTVQGGGGNINILITGKNKEVNRVINTEAFGVSIKTTLPSKLAEDIELIHGLRIDDNIERWTAGGDRKASGDSHSFDRRGIKASIIHLKDLAISENKAKLKQIANKLGIKVRDITKSPLITQSWAEIRQLDDANRQVTEAAKAGDPLALALEKSLFELTMTVVKQEIEKIKAIYPDHTVQQFSYHGGSVQGRMDKLGMAKEAAKILGLRESQVIKHAPDLDGTRSITQRNLRKALHASPYAKA